MSGSKGQRINFCTYTQSLNLFLLIINSVPLRNGRRPSSVDILILIEEGFEMHQLNDKDLRSIKRQVIPQLSLGLVLFLYGGFANNDSIGFAGWCVLMGAYCYAFMKLAIRAGYVHELFALYPVDSRASRLEQELELERIPKIEKASNPEGFWMRVGFFMFCVPFFYVLAGIVLVCGIEAIRS